MAGGGVVVAASSKLTRALPNNDLTLIVQYTNQIAEAAEVHDLKAPCACLWIGFLACHFKVWSTGQPTETYAEVHDLKADATGYVSRRYL